MESEGIKQIYDLGAAASTGPITACESMFLLVPPGFTAKKVEPREEPLPSFITQGVRIDTEASFTSYVNEFKVGATKLFYLKSARCFVAVFDYHEPGQSEQTQASVAKAGRKAHRATLTLQHSAAWDAWANIDGKKTGQSEFAEFLEEHLGDVRTPDGATMLEVATKLQVNRQVQFLSSKNLGNGTVNFVYQEEDSATAGKNTIAIPTEITLGLIVFDGDTEGYQVNAKFRYSLDGGKLSFKVKLLDLDRVIEAATADIARRIADQSSEGLARRPEAFLTATKS